MAEPVDDAIRADLVTLERVRICIPRLWKSEGLGEGTSRDIKICAGDVWEDYIGHKVLIIQIDPYRNDFNYPVIGMTLDKTFLSVLKNKYQMRYPRYTREGLFSTNLEDREVRKLTLIRRVNLPAL